MAKRRTVVIPLNLGSADGFDRSIFPMSLSKSDALSRGELFLDATVEEVLSIASMCTSLGQSEDFAKTTRLRYTELMQEKTRLENRTTTRNPFKELVNYRAVKIFYKAAKSLYIETRTTSELMAGSLKDKPRVVSIEGEERPKYKYSELGAKENGQPTLRNNEESPSTPLTSSVGPVSAPSREEQPANESLPERPTIQGIVTSGVDPDQVPELTKTLADAFRVFTSGANAPAIKAFMSQLDALMDGSLDPATLQATQNEKSGHTTTSQASLPAASCSASSSVKIVLKDTIIAPGAIFIGTSLSQGRSSNSGPVRHDVTVPPPPESV